MPFKSKAQQRFMFATQPKTAEKWAEETPNIKSLPQKVKKEGKESKMTHTVNFWVVLNAVSPTENPMKLLYQTDPISFANQMRGGVAIEDIYGFFLEEDDALTAAHDQVEALYEAAKALEEKKAMVSDKLQKTVDKLQKEAQSCMKSMKEQPEKADEYHAKLEGIMARLKELRGKHKMVEESKRELAKKDYDKDGKLETPEEEYKGTKDKAIKQSKKGK